MMRSATLRLLAATALITLPTMAHAARDQIRAVGSSTVYPFVTAAAESFGQGGKFKTPIVESTGTGGGFKLFCDGVGEAFPDITNASRAIKDSEKELCAKNGVKDITELAIGYDGIVIANSVKGKTLDLTKKQLFMALARELPGKDGKLVKNPYTKWSEIDAKLPAIGIEIYGPPPTSGTRDAFVELVMEKACEEFPEFLKAIPDEKTRKNACKLLREDGKYIEAGEDDNLIIQKLTSNPNAFGIFGYSFLEENKSKVQGSTIAGVAPTYDNIENGKYSVSRSMYVYVKNAHIGVIPGLAEFAKELTSNGAIGKNGYLVQRGLLPLHDGDLKKSQTAAAALKAPAK